MAETIKQAKQKYANKEQEKSKNKSSVTREEPQATEKDNPYITRAAQWFFKLIC